MFVSCNKGESYCDLLLAKTVSNAVSVVKTDRVQGGTATNRVRREISISVAAP